MRSVLSKVCDHNPVPKAALSRNVSIGRGERINNDSVHTYNATDAEVPAHSRIHIEGAETDGQVWVFGIRI